MTGCLMDVVLLVEDDEDMREDVAFLLERRGHRVVTAEHGKAALEKLSGLQSPCLILLDLMMPEMDGWQLRAKLREDPDLASIPIVVVSALADIAQEAASLGAVDYLQKPVDFDKLYELVDRRCGHACVH